MYLYVSIYLVLQKKEVLQSNEGYHRIATLQYIANNLFLQRTLTVDHFFDLPDRPIKIAINKLQSC